MNNAVRRAGALLAISFLSLTGTMASNAGAQDSPEGFPLPANAAYCEPGFLGPFVGCTPWEGLPITFVALDREFVETCITEANDGRTASCVVHVPFGSTIVASIMPGAVPEGYVLQGETALEFTIPDGPPEGLFGGPSFVLFAQDDGGDGDLPVIEDDTPQDTSGDVISLPSTGAGTTTHDAGTGPLVAAVVASAAALLAGGAAGMRRMRR